MKLISIILTFVFFFFMVTFSMQNTEEVTIQYYGVIKSITAPLFTILLATLLLGIIIGGIGWILTDFKLRMELRGRKKEVEKMRKELDTLRAEITPKPESVPFFPLKE